MTEQLTEGPIPAASTEISDFVAQVRAHLADLDPDEQGELTADLQADMADLVADSGPDALADPAAYARELRSAAGHSAVMPERRFDGGVRDSIVDAIDSTHHTWNRLLGSMPGDVRGFLTVLQPVWWVLRAWVAWMVVQDVRGPYVIVDSARVLVLLAFVILSVQLGRRAWHVDRLLSRSVLARMLLIALNVFAVAALPGQPTGWLGMSPKIGHTSSGGRTAEA